MARYKIYVHQDTYVVHRGLLPELLAPQVGDERRAAEDRDDHRDQRRCENSRY